MNLAQKRADLQREGQVLTAALKVAEEKNIGELAFQNLRDKFDKWESDMELLEFEEKQHKTKTLRAFGGSLSTTGPNDGVLPMGATGKGKDVFPLAISKKDARAAFEAIKRGQNYIVQAKDATTSFSTVEPLLVPQQAPGIVPEYFESRLVDHLPCVGISAPSYQFLQHQYASDTGGPGFVAEGQLKPQWEPTAEKVIVTAQKAAVYFNISAESLADAPTWESYLINTGYQKLYQLENNAILYGVPSSGLGIQGWSTQAGVLTHNAASDPSGSTNLDSIELAINAMRVQSGVFAVPDILVMSPSTFSHTRRTKATTGEYIAGNPLQSAVHSLWGIPVLTTTACNDGDAFLVDSSKFGSVLVREGLSMHMGYTGYGLVENVVTIVEEERFALANVIPSAVQYVTNLAVG